MSLLKGAKPSVLWLFLVFWLSPIMLNAQHNTPLKGLKSGEFKSLVITCVQPDSTAFLQTMYSFDKKGSLKYLYSKSLGHPSMESKSYFLKDDTGMLYCRQMITKWVTDTLVTERNWQHTGDGQIADTLIYSKGNSKDTLIQSFDRKLTKFHLEFPLFVMTGEELAHYFSAKNDVWEVTKDSLGRVSRVQSLLTNTYSSGCVIYTTSLIKYFTYREDGKLAKIVTHSDGFKTEMEEVFYTNGMPSMVKGEKKSKETYTLILNFKPY